MNIKLNKIGKKIILDSLLRLAFDAKEFIFSVNPKQDFGDYSTNVAFLYSKHLKKVPFEVAKIVAEEIINDPKSSTFFSKIVPEKNGYINFFVSEEYLEKNINYIHQHREPFKGFLRDTKKQYIIEFSSPNMVKPFTIGYLRSTIIGDVISNIFSYSGKKIVRDNHLGDWGVQFGKIICAVDEYSSISTIKKLESPYDELLRLYKFFLEQEKLDSRLTHRAEKHFQRLESKDVNTILVWNEIRSILNNGLQNIYSILEISFDNISWESNVQDSVQSMIDELVMGNIAQVSNDAVIVNLDNYDLSKMVLRKKKTAQHYTEQESLQLIRLESLNMVMIL